jgi:hypothetical protein
MVIQYYKLISQRNTDGIVSDDAPTVIWDLSAARVVEISV